MSRTWTDRFKGSEGKCFLSHQDVGMLHQYSIRNISVQIGQATMLSPPMALASVTLLPAMFLSCREHVTTILRQITGFDVS